MAEVINFRIARKARIRANAESTAAENRAHFGRTKAERAAQDQEAKRLASIVDNAKREDI